MSTTETGGARVFLTGATGFVGKVVLEELMRRRSELGIERVYLLIRPRKGLSAEERFEQSVATSHCFSLLDSSWREICHPIAGNMTEEELGISSADLKALRADLTHVIHCAASIRFDLPIRKAADVNITGALRTLRFVQSCPGIRRFVDVSTAYVTPHPGEGVVAAEEQLVDFPLDAEETYHRILKGSVDEDELLAITGHPNTYTFTKCLAEIILAKNRGDTPLTLLRPSIVSVCRRHPFPGWIDSHAAYAAFISLLGAGHLRVVRSDPNTVLDVVPCDDVADRILSCAFDPALQEPFLIRHAVVGLTDSGRTGDLARKHVEFFQGSPHDREPYIAYLGHSKTSYKFRQLLHHTIPLRATEVGAQLVGQRQAAKQMNRMVKWLEYLDDQFHYFVHRTFDFRTAFSRLEAFDLDEYLETVSGGVSEHLLNRDPIEVPLRMQGGDLSWALRQPGANLTTRVMAYIVRKALRRGRAQVTFDERRIRAALRDIEPDDFIILAPIHRSYLDFLLTSLFCFAHPGLGLRLPKVAATDDFAKIPIVGWVLKKAGAFYIQRGTGVPDPNLTRQIERLVRKGHPLSFYPEGTRSRGRRFLRPKRGILRAIHQTGRPAIVIPISISYDRIAEEVGFARELERGVKHKGGLRPLLQWNRALRRGDIHLGRIHISAGEALRIEPDSDIHALSNGIVSELQKHVVASTFHLRVFVESHPELEIDPAGLRSAILRRSGQVLDSTLDGKPNISDALERTYEAQWMHLFYADALALHPENAAIAAHVRRNGFWYPEARRKADPIAAKVVEGLFRPVCRDFQRVAEEVEKMPADGTITAHELTARTEGLFLLDVEDTLIDLVERGYLVADRAVHRWADGPRDLSEYRASCAWPEPTAHESLIS